MAERVSARLTAAQGRRFGVTVGGAFLAFTAIAWWRGHSNTANMLGALGLVLTVAGVAIPTHLGPVERAWMALAQAMSKVTTPVVMAIMYLGAITPVGMVRRVLGGNPLVHAPQADSFWKARRTGRSNMRRQF